MEITPPQIAKLVLGYLKAEKCKVAVEAFIDSSGHLRDLSDTIRKSKHFLTRVLGYSLTDIVTEYAKLYTIIQEYLEDTSYFAENSSRSLTDQLIYLLDNGRRTRPNTPHRSRSSTPNRHRQKNKEFPRDLSVINENNGDIDTTPLHDLPGHDSSSAVNESDAEPENQQELLGKVLTETILENHELQERIAENINAVIYQAQSRQQESQTQSHDEAVNSELDFAINAIVQKTTGDPVFEKLMSELLGPAEPHTDQNGPDVPSNQNKSKTEEKVEIPPKPDESETPQTPARVATVPRRQTITIDGTRVDTKDLKNQSVTTTSEVIVYDGTLENYMKDAQPSQISAAQTSVPSTSGLVLNNGLLMVQQGVVPQQTQPYYLWNPSQIVNVSVPQYKVNALSEQDILTMPTVIVCDDTQQQAVVVPAAANTVNPDNTTRPLKKILMKEGPISPPPLIIFPEVKKKPPAKRKSKSKTIKIIASKEDPVNPDVMPEIPQPFVSLTRIEETPSKELLAKDEMKEEATKEVEEDKKEGLEGNNVGDSPKQSTPKLRPTPAHKGTSTPKSGSHVRALDFNFGTPRQGSSVKKRAVTSPLRKTPVKTSQPKVSKSLFASPSKQKTTEAQPKTELKKAPVASWDADLRVLAAGCAKSPSPKKRRVAKKKKISNTKRDNMNKTDIDAKAIEENLLLDAKPEEKKEECLEVLVNEEEEQPFTLVNCNRAARFNKKCNIDNNVKKEVKVTKVKEIKSLDFTDGKMILSPSKLNANKRSLVDYEATTSEKHDISLTPLLGNFSKSEVLTLNFERTKTEEKPAKLITPDFQKPQTSNFPMTATRNLIPLLETPVKTDYNTLLPKTPNIVSPITVKDTPLTKMFKEQCQGVDLASIPTPQFPITPSFPITPLGNYSPYENRPTDYSTSSSYYHPSDNEQNKSIEQLIEETKKKKTTAAKKSEVTEKPSEPIPMIANKLSSFNRNMIGRKNLSLVSKADTISFGDSTSSEFSINSSDSSDEENNTVILKKSETSRYPLRSRNKKVEPAEKITKKTIDSSDSEGDKSPKKAAKEVKNTTKKLDSTDSSDEDSSKEKDCRESDIKQPEITEEKLNTGDSNLKGDAGTNDKISIAKKEESNPKEDSKVIEEKKCVAKNPNLKEESSSSTKGKKSAMKNDEPIEEKAVTNLKNTKSNAKEDSNLKEETVTKNEENVDEKIKSKNDAKKDKKANNNSKQTQPKSKKATEKRKSRVNKPKESTNENAKTKEVKTGQKSLDKDTANETINEEIVKTKDVKIGRNSLDKSTTKEEIAKTKEVKTGRNLLDKSTAKETTKEEIVKTKEVKTGRNLLDKSTVKETTKEEIVKTKEVKIGQNLLDKSTAKEPTKEEIVKTKEVQTGRNSLDKIKKGKPDEVVHDSSKENVDDEPKSRKSKEFKKQGNTSKSHDEIETDDCIKSILVETDSALRTKESILMELECKRQQMIAKFKESESTTHKRKPAAPKTKKPKCAKKETISSDDDHLSPSLLVETHFEDSNPNAEKERSDACMVRDLKERGIYLIPKRKAESKLEPPDDNSCTEPIEKKLQKKVENSLPLKKRDKTLEETIRKLQETIQVDKGNVTITKEIKETVGKSEIRIEEIAKTIVEENPLKSCLSQSHVLHEDLNLTDSFTEIAFDYFSKPNEDLTLIYDPEKTSKKTLEDYNFALVTKTLKATVFLEEFNADAVRIMSITPMDHVLSIPEKDGKEKVKILENIALSNFSPLQRLYKELVHQPTNADFAAKSPLEDLYDPSPKRLGQIRRSERRRKSVDVRPNVKNLKPRVSRSVSVDQNFQKDGERKGDETEIRVGDVLLEDKERLSEEMGNVGSGEIDDGDSRIVKADDDDAKKVTKPTKSRSSKSGSSEMDLMDYSIVGAAEKDTSTQSISSTSHSKRKANDEIQGEKTKRPKEDAQEMLKRIDVEYFLSQIHNK